MSYYETNDLHGFGIYSNQSLVILEWLYQAIWDASQAKETPEFIISLIGIFLNIFHLIILTQKSMRSTSINVLMIGIAISDLCIMICSVYYYVLNYIVTYSECDVPWSYFRTLADLLIDAMKKSFRRISAWLGVLMAVIRFLIIKNPLNPKFDILSRPSFSWTAISVLIILSTSLALAEKGRTRITELEPWTPPESCTGFPENFTEKQYFTFIPLDTELDFLIETMFMASEGVLKIIPAILLPILAFLLVRELKTAAKARQKLTSSQGNEKDRTTNLVILMTVSFMITEGSIGIFCLAQGFVTKGFLAMCSNMTELLNILVALNATTHCLICMTMSSQYRNCAKSLFCGKVEPKPVIVSPKSSVSSRTSVRNVEVQI